MCRVPAISWRWFGQGTRLGLSTARSLGARLTDSEVAQEIGPHDGGQHDYLLGGCVWSSTAGEKDGLVEAIHATVLPAAQYEIVAEVGGTVSGFGTEATYANLHGELWFPCHSGDFCGIKANISDPDRRQDVALRLGKVLQNRA
ncbi:hypothetical protein [Nocardia brevicatena]|uniref:hypothetical protein n=1 Tax=Nocardia brevicatena TaxID=37327 RepID=UPI0012F87160|nr:hypothetical protein [Nocardia brevicatena]